MHVKTEKELYIWADRPRSTLNIFGLVVDRNRVDVIVESGPLQYCKNSIFDLTYCSTDSRFNWPLKTQINTNLTFDRTISPNLALDLQFNRYTNGKYWSNKGGQATTPVWLPEHNFHWKLCLRHCTTPVCLPYRTFPLFLLIYLALNV